MVQKNGKIRDVMTANPKCVSEKDSVTDVARIMKDSDTGVVPVVEGKKIIGLVTDRDIVVRGLAAGKDMSKASVTDVMTRGAKTVQEDASIEEVLNLMSSSEIRRMPVVNDKQELVGIVSIGDIASQDGGHGKVGKTIEDISQAPPNN